MKHPFPSAPRALLTSGLLAVSLGLCWPATALDKLTYHNDLQRSGWNAQETQLAPASVAAASFGQLWQTPQFDSVDGVAPRLYATPLYVDQVLIPSGHYAGKTFSVIYAATDVGYVYAVNAKTVGEVAAGTILWRKRVAAARPAVIGNLSTPTIDLPRQRLYMLSGDGNKPYSVHALDIRTGDEVSGWPVAITQAAVNAPGINRNGSTQFSDKVPIQRGALNLSPNGDRVYVSFAQGAVAGWLMSIDTNRAAVASAFSATARSEEAQGGMWASGGPSVDKDGYVHIATGSSVQVHLKKLGMAGIFPDSEHNWGQSVLRLRDDPKTGFELVGTYSPFNYAQAQVMDIDIGSSGNIVIDIDPAITSTPQLLVQGGKQGTVYLLDRAHMPGSLIKRPPISNDSSTDGSLLPPEPQPQYGKRGPLNVFGPYADENAMNDQARSRTTAAYFKTAANQHYVFVTGSAKTGDKLETSTPPGLARLQIVTAPGKPAYLKIDQLEATQTFQNPGSPVITSNGGRDAIVWVLDTNVRRTAPMHGPDAAHPVLYAFDAVTFKLLWKSAPDELGTTGKYNEPTVINGLAIVGTDRIQAFGLQAAAERPHFASVFSNTTAAPAKPAADPAVVLAGKTIFEQRCGVCHNSGAAGIPPRAKISKLEPGKIVETLQNGIMRPQATGLKEDEIKSIATYLTSLPSATEKDEPANDRKLNLAGRAVYVQQCISCHMPDGSGVPTLQPDLRKSTVVSGKPVDLIRKVLDGSTAGKAANKNHAYKTVLSDAEAADLLTYVRQAFGKLSQPTPVIQNKQIAAQRKR